MAGPGALELIVLIEEMWENELNGRQIISLNAPGIKFQLFHYSVLELDDSPFPMIVPLGY